MFESDNASGFCKKALGHTLMDVGCRLESWTILQNQTPSSAHSVRDLHKKCVGKISDGLREITGREDIAMNYQNYNTSIMSRYKVQLTGWPSYIPFTNPSNLSTLHLQRLNDALQSTQCRWQLMMREEVSLHNAKYDSSMASEHPVTTTRKERSDKNQKRKAWDVPGVESAEKHRKRGPRSRMTTGGMMDSRVSAAQGRCAKVVPQLPPGPLSNEFILSDSDREEDSAPITHFTC